MERQLPITNSPLVVLTDFENPQAWKTIRELISAPVPAPGDTFYAYVQFLEDPAFRGLGTEGFLERVPAGYNHSFIFVVDSTAIAHPEFPVLVIELRRDGRTFRAIPSAIQSIENNLSISNMDFFEFADAAGEDGIFRGFPPP